MGTKLGTKSLQSYHPPKLIQVPSKGNKWFVVVTKPKDLQRGKNLQVRRSTGTTDQRIAETRMPALAEKIYAEFDKELGGIDRFKIAAFDLMRNDHYDPEVSYPANTWTDTYRDSTELEIIEGLFEDGGLDMVKPLLDLALPETRATLEHWAEDHRKCLTTDRWPEQNEQVRQSVQHIG